MSTETTEQTPQPDIVSARGKTGPGNRLRQARLANKQDIAAIATRLHLTVTVVQALEKDDYTDLTARVFVRGYLRNYARLVNVSVATVLTQFDEIWPPTEPPVKVTPPPRLAADSHPKNRWWQRMTWLILLLGTLLFLLWWQGYLSHFWQQQTTQIASPEETTLFLPENNLTPLEPATDTPPSTEILLPNPEPSYTNEPATEDIAPQTPAPVQNTELPLTQDGDETSTADTLSEELITIAEPAPPIEIVPPKVTIAFQEACWVNIRDKTRTFKLIGKMAAGTRYQLRGEAPYQIVIGNAAVAAISIDGQPYNLKQHTRKNVARFILQP